MSSRNTYLSEEERRRAPSIFRSLEVARALFLDGERRARAIKEKVEAFLKDADVQVEYVSVCHPDTLQELDRIEGSAVVLVACWIGRTRLIDNIFLREDGSPCGE
jgi:pantoate--beta-alanine ligase